MNDEPIDAMHYFTNAHGMKTFSHCRRHRSRCNSSKSKSFGRNLKLLNASNALNNGKVESNQNEQNIEILSYACSMPSNGVKMSL